ncbi:hypothetical protein [Rhodococcus oxybenzonivorans]|uniref:hypothetical protein n=1 Tax=Rhodococcus oxybenzonivorans TaxID=1990687 RepID=UPI0013A5B7AF|nr:hypothetical protein [Rhodococcus oxybenzonivorans]
MNETDQGNTRARDWLLSGVLDLRVSLGLGACVLLLAVIGTSNNGPGLVTAIVVVCLAASVIAFVAAVTRGAKDR